MELYNPSSQHENEVLKSHPLFFPVLNGMIECALAGWGSPNQQLRLPPHSSIPVSSETNTVDRFMLDALQAQWSNKQELEFLQASVSDFCKGAVVNLEKATYDILQCKPGDLQDYGSIKLSSSPVHPTQHRMESMHETHNLPPPISMNYINNQSHVEFRPDYGHNNPIMSPPSEKKLKNPKSLPKEATEILKSWIIEHWENPYPDEATKQLLVEETGLNRSQVVNWFINARRRLIKPMKPELEKRKAEKLQKRTRVTVTPNSFHEESEGSDSDPDYEEPIAKKKKPNFPEGIPTKEPNNGSDQVKRLISNWKHTSARKRSDENSNTPYCFSTIYVEPARANFTDV